MFYFFFRRGGRTSSRKSGQPACTVRSSGCDRSACSFPARNPPASVGRLPFRKNTNLFINEWRGRYGFIFYRVKTGLFLLAAACCKRGAGECTGESFPRFPGFSVGYEARKRLCGAAGVARSARGRLRPRCFTEAVVRFPGFSKTGASGDFRCGRSA